MGDLRFRVDELKQICTLVCYWLLVTCFWLSAFSNQKPEASNQ